MIKGAFSKLKMPTISVLMVVSMLFGGVATTYGVSEIIYSSYAKSSQMDDLVKELNCIDTYKMSPGKRLQHNNGEPIYISFKENFTSEQKKEITRAIDYIFGIIGGINSNYKYEIVESVDDNKYFNKTTIVFEINELGKAMEQEVNGQLFFDKQNRLPQITDRGIMGKSVRVGLDDDFLHNPKNQERIFDVALHELLHAFGIDDVYFIKTFKHISNTQINVGVTEMCLNMISPNDYKLLASMYHKPFKTQEEKKKFIDKFNLFIEEYSQSYYKKHYETTLQKRKKELINNGFSDRIINKLLEVTPLEDINITISSKYSERSKYLNIKVLDGKYFIEALDENEQLVSSCSGKAYYIDGVIYMQGVHLNSFVMGLDTTTDMALCYKPFTENYILTTLSGEEYEYSLEKSFSQNIKADDGMVK